MGDPEASSGTSEDLGWGEGEVVIGGCCLREGENRGRQGRAPHFPASPLSSPSCTPEEQNITTTKSSIFISQSLENCSLHCIYAAGYQFGPAPSQCLGVKCASVSPLEPALPNLPVSIPTSPSGPH